MKILFLGGTGIISTACTQLAVARGHEVALLNRSRLGHVPGTRQITADVTSPDVARALGGETWDAVVDFIAYDAAAVDQRLGLFRGRVGQYVFISTTSAYQRPLRHYLITESTPLANPWWEYSRLKIDAEERLNRACRDEGFPITIVRPSLTYGDTNIPLAVNARGKSFTNLARLRAGKPLIVPGDGLSLWTITHNTDFAKGLVGLLGHAGAIGHAFHITSDEVLTWDQIYLATAEAAGVGNPRLVHIASDFISACLPELTGTLLGDKSHSAVFDNSKIKRFVPDFVATTRFRDGIARSVRWFDADPVRQVVDAEADARWDRLIAAYERGLAAAKSGA
ncbi:MAG: NAD-dependent epimerase/dehydratase family protein [Verrucomicrobia bacterium]|nr:NAD-dependent epimerase/dehydratase family protein [Verrucomicrobiota bacterium]